MPDKIEDACLIQDFPWQEVQTPSFAEFSEDSMKQEKLGFVREGTFALNSEYVSVK